MRRRVLLCLTLISLSACNGDKIGQPISSPLAPPSRSISDGTHSLGNPDFFFLPPMVKNPSSSPNWDAGAFNGALKPVVHVCAMTGTTEATAALTTNCSDLATQVSLSDEMYSVNWQVPNSSTVFYRLSVLAGTKVLGWADVETASNASQLKNVTTGDYIALVDGRTLPIKFRIERYALCDVPGTGPCASSDVNLNTGGTVSTVVVVNGQPAGITIPAGAGTISTTITVQSCPNLPLDIPLFGTCVRVTADPALPPSGFAVAATVFICDVSDASVQGRVLDHAQSERITLHRLDPGVEGPVITALPHAPACGAQIASTDGTMRGMLAALRRGSVGAAAREALSMLAPKPLYAARFIDLGGGGFTSDLSDFQFALPAAFVKDRSTDGVLVDAGGVVNPAVTVVDLDGSPVRGATVRFAAGTGSNVPLSVVTGPDGRASTAWTVSSSIAANSLTASGRGIAGSDNNGPREGIDPFQPIQTLGAPLPTDLPVQVFTGSVTFAATALLPPIDSFGFGGQWQYLLLGSGSPPSGWEQPGFAMSGWSTGSAPFGFGACPDLPAAATVWPLGSTDVPSDILLRKTFSTRAPGSFQIAVMIDNDVQVFVDGAQISDGFFVHEGCANLSPPSFTVSNLPAGNHVLAVHARDRGVASFVDAMISPLSP